MPPRMLPTATPMLPASAALTVIASSGRFVATASRITPPSAVPRCHRVASTSVWLDNEIPAIQTVTAATRKMRMLSQRGEAAIEHVLPRSSCAATRPCRAPADAFVYHYAMIVKPHDARSGCSVPDRGDSREQRGVDEDVHLRELRPPRRGFPARGRVSAGP